MYNKLYINISCICINLKFYFKKNLDQVQTSKHPVNVCGKYQSMDAFKLKKKKSAEAVYYTHMRIHIVIQYNRIVHTVKCKQKSTYI